MTLTEFKAGDRVRFKSIEELSKLKFISNGIYNFAGKEFTIAATGVAYTPYSEIKLEILPKEEGYIGYFIYDTMIEHIPVDSGYIKVKFGSTFDDIQNTSKLNKRPEYMSISVPVLDYMRTATGAIYAAKHGISISTPYIDIDTVPKSKLSGYPVICDECEEEEVHIAKRRISFSKIQ